MTIIDHSAARTDTALALRQALDGMDLLGFKVRALGFGGAPQAKAAFVGFDKFFDVTATSGSGAGSLAAELQAEASDVASNPSNSDAIVFDPSIVGQTITLPSSLTITAPVTILGASGGTTISGSNSFTDFVVNTGSASGSTNFNNLAITNGTGTGAAGTAGSTSSTSSAINGGPGGDAAGGIFVQSGAVNLFNDSFANDAATGGQGGAAGFTGNNAQTKGAGGTGGNAAGAVYVEPGATVGSASGLTATSVSGTGGMGGSAAPGGGTAGAAGSGYPVSNNAAITNATTTTVCYCAGTRIRVQRDGAVADVAVEDLVVGDLAVTASGAHRPIRWIGSRLTQCRNHPRPHEAQPVRVRAHAFGPDRPARDLLVSPGHALCVDLLGEVLIPAMALINGTTIVQEHVDSVTYWHVELDSHDILLAENLPCESYLEMGNRSFFADAGVVALDAVPDADTSARTHADFCRPYHDGGVLVDAVRWQLRARAERLGWRLEDGGMGDIHLLVDGRRLEPQVRGLSARWTLPAGSREVWLVSRTSVPAESMSLSPDRRTLGVYVGALTIDDGFGIPRRILADDERLCCGFHAAEPGPARWTAGRARLPAELWNDMAGDVFLRVDLGTQALPRWVAPAIAEDDVSAFLTLVA